MASGTYNLGEYKPINMTQESDSGLPDSKHLANFRQNSKFSEQFAVESRASGSIDGSQPMRRYDRMMERLNSIWAWEAAAVILSLACLAVVIWQLVFLDGTSMSKWRLPISPNSFLAIFMTLSKSTMLVAVTAGIAQLRWLHYESAPRNLDELDAFDEASRGPYGALMFVFFSGLVKGRARLAATFGALLVVLSLAMDPFAQQIFSYSAQDVLGAQDVSWAWLPASVQETQHNSFLTNDVMKKAIYGGLLGFDVPVDFYCSTGNCTWPAFTSLGVCSECVDARPLATTSCVARNGVLNQTCSQINYDIPSYNLNMTLNNGSVGTFSFARAYTMVKGVSGEGLPDGLDHPAQFKFAIAQLALNVESEDSTITRAMLDAASWNLTACTISWCAKLYQGVTSVNGSLQNTDSVDVPLKALSNSSCFNPSNQTCQEFVAADPSQMPPELANIHYSTTVSNDSSGIRHLLDLDFNLTLTGETTTLKRTGDYSIGNSIFWNTDIAQSMDRVMRTYTAYLRSNVLGTRIPGRAATRQSFVDVTWAWFALPATLVLTSAAFLILVIVMSNWRGQGNEPLWKTSTLPLLLHGLDGWDRSAYTGTESRVAMDVKARSMRARLRRDSHRGSHRELMFVKTDEW